MAEAAVQEGREDPNVYGQESKDSIAGDINKFVTGQNIGAPPVATAPPGIPLGAPKTPPQRLPLADVKNNPVLPSPDLATKRAEDASWALEGRTVQSTDELTNAIMSGKENDVRQITSLEDSQLRTANVLTMASPDQKQILRAMQPINQQYFWEHKYAQRIVDNMMNGDIRYSNDEYNRIQQQHPGMAEVYAESQQSISTKLLYAQKKLEDLSSKSSLKSWGWSALKDIVIPFRHSYEVTGTVAGAFAPGTAQRDEAYRLLSMDVDNFVRESSKRGDELAAYDIELAKDYWNGIINHGQSDEYLSNFFNAIDIGSRVLFPGVVARTVGRGLAAAELERVSISAIKATSRGVISGKPANVVADVAAGSFKTAGIKNVARTMFKDFDPKPTEPHFENQLDRVWSFLDYRKNKLMHDPADLMNETSRRMYEIGMTRTADMVQRWTNAIRNTPLLRLIKDPRFLQAMYEEEVEGGAFRGAESHIMDYGNPVVDSSTNTGLWRLYLGRFDGEGFNSFSEAQASMNAVAFMKGGVIREYEAPGKVTMKGLTSIARSQGRKYYVEVLHPMKTDTPLINSALETGFGNDAPTGLLEKYVGFLSKFASPENTMAPADILERKMATYMPNHIMESIMETIQPLQSLGYSLPGFSKRKLMKDLKRIVKLTQKRRDPNTGKPGVWYENAGELSSAYQSYLKRVPTDLETAAYFAMKDVSDMDWMARNARVYTNDFNWGAKKLTVQVLAPGANWMTDRRYSTSKPFHGRAVADIPRHKDANIAFFTGSNIDDMDIKQGHRLGKTHEKFSDLAKQGELKVFEVQRPHDFPLSGYGLAKDKDLITHIVTKPNNVKEDLIDAVQVPYTGAGHLIPKSKFVLAQPHMRYDRISQTWHYVGNTTFGMVPQRAWGKAMEKHLDKLQELTRDGKVDEAKAYHLDNEIPWSHDDWDRWTKGYVDAQGKFQQPHINLKDPIRVIPTDTAYIDSEHGQALKDRYGDKFRDINRTTAAQHKVAFTQERDMEDLRELRNEGSTKNPLWKFEPAELLDPLPSLERGVNAIIRSQWMDDHKINTIKRWLNDGINKKYFQVSPEEIRKSPFWYFHRPEELYRKELSKNERDVAEGNRLKILNFTGINSRTETMTHGIMQKMVDGLYDSGHKWASDRLIGIWDWAQDHDPGRLLRSMVFHKSLGLFSIPIMILHASTMANGAMIAGLRPSAMGFVGMWLHGMAAFNRSEKFLNHLDKIAQGMGYKPGHWLEAYHLTSEIPFLHEPGTFALHEEALSARLIPTAYGKFLHAGLAPFNFGLKTMRAFSWYTAAHEIRRGGGGMFNWTPYLGKLTNDHKMQLLARADQLAHNMTRASANYLNTGWRQTPMQFMTYHNQLLNLAIGKQLTTAEKSRFLAGNALLYGIGAPLSLYSFGMSDLIFDWNQEAIKNGYVPGENTVKDFMVRGIPAAIMAYASGDFQNEYWMNVADRFGPKGLAHQFLGHDPSQTPGLLDLAGGPLVSTAHDMWTAFTPFWRSIMSMMPGGSDGPPRWQLTSNHIMSAFRRISSINNAYTAYFAARYGKWYTRDGGLPVETDMPTWAAIMGFATGLRSQEQVDMYAKQRIIQNDKKAGEAIMKEARTLMERATEAAEQENYDQADQNWEDAFALMEGLTYNEKRRVPEMIRSDSQIRVTNQEYYNINRVKAEDQGKLLEEKNLVSGRRGF
jgi:hypothetical protein